MQYMFGATNLFVDLMLLGVGWGWGAGRVRCSEEGIRNYDRPWLAGVQCCKIKLRNVLRVRRGGRIKLFERSTYIISEPCDIFLLFRSFL
jgi:hypothetical protein